MSHLDGSTSLAAFKILKSKGSKTAKILLTRASTFRLPVEAAGCQFRKAITLYFQLSEKLKMNAGLG